MSLSDAAVFLFHREFRLFDNTGLNAIARSGKKIIPVFIFDPVQIDPKKNKYFSNGSVQFMCESLSELDKDIRKLGSKMIFMHGDTVQTLDKLHKKLKFGSIVSHEDNTPFADARDAAVKKWADSRDIEFLHLEDYDLYGYRDGLRQGRPYAVYTPFYNYCLKNLDVRPVDSFKLTKQHFVTASKLSVPGSMDSKRIHDYYEFNEHINLHGGRHNGEKRLANLKNFKDYDKTRDDINDTEGTSHLSPYIKYGIVSVREIFWKVEKMFGVDHALIRELIWRSFYYKIAKFTDVLKGRSFKELSNPKYGRVQWSKSPTLLRLFASGQTGFPLVDAAMVNLLGGTAGNLQLSKKRFMGSNWLHNRLRMLTASFACKSLRLDYRDVEKILARGFIDYDPSSTNGGVQWGSGLGSDTQLSRTFSPWRQSERYDPDANYIKKWLPQLREIPAKDIHHWYEAFKKYPDVQYSNPIVNHQLSVKKTLSQIYAALK